MRISDHETARQKAAYYTDAISARLATVTKAAELRLNSVSVPDQIPTRAVREPRFYRSDIQAVLGFCVLASFLVLLAIKV